jgi:hypothetical protein
MAPADEPLTLRPARRSAYRGKLASSPEGARHSRRVRPRSRFRCQESGCRLGDAATFRSSRSRLGETNQLADPGSVCPSSLQRLDDKHSVEAAFDQLFVDLRLRRHHAQLLTAAERDELSVAPVRNRGHERCGIVRFAVRRDPSGVTRRYLKGMRPIVARLRRDVLRR